MEFSLFDKFVGMAFTEVLWPVWKKALVKAGAPRVWSKCFQISAESVGIDPSFAAHYSRLPALQRLLINTFKPDRPIPSATDFAVSIAFEQHQQDHKCTFNVRLSSSEIRHWAAGARQAWLDTIIESTILRGRYKDVRDKHPAAAMGADASCMPDLDKTLDDRVTLLKTYFSSFSAPNATETVYVWLPSDRETVHSEPGQRILVPVPLNTTQGADRGFFRVGYDYSLRDDSPIESLHICYLDDKRLMEAGQFGCRSIGKRTDHILWLR